MSPWCGEEYADSRWKETGPEICLGSLYSKHLLLCFKEFTVVSVIVISVLLLRAPLYNKSKYKCIKRKHPGKLKFAAYICRSAGFGLKYFPYLAVWVTTRIL